jgi:hypothetical protein
MQPISWKALLGLAIVILAGAFLWGGRYTIAGQGSLIFVVDRFTGAVRVCRVDQCRSIPYEPLVQAKEEAAKSAATKGYFDDITKADDGGFNRVEPASPTKKGLFDDIMPQQKNSN